MGKIIRNKEIREHARIKNVYLWEIAAEIGIQPETFSKKLRVEFPGDERQKVLQIIDTISARDQEVDA